MTAEYPETETLHPTDREALVACLEIGKLLTSTHDHKKIFELIMTRGRQLIKAQHWSLLLKDETTGDLIFEIVVGADKNLFTPIKLSANDGIAPYVARTGIPMFVPDVTLEPRFNKNVDLKTGFVTRSIVCVPLSIHGKISGVIEIVNIEDMDFFNSTEYPILTILADYTAIAIENSRYISKIETLSVTDEYTGLHNARFMHEYLDMFFTSETPSGKTVAAIFIDVDDFKDIVDIHGHLSGSDILRQVGMTIKGQLSDNDILIKYGGDEYVIILPERNALAAAKRSESISRAISTTPYTISQSTSVNITASFGVAAYPENASDKTSLLIAADNALFKIKNRSKNSIGCA